MSDVDALLPAEMARRAEGVGVAKAAMPLARLAVLGVLGGAFIALGAAFSTAVTAGDGMAPGIARLLGGLTFSLGLVLVVVGGAELFTGNMLIVMAAVGRRVRVRAVLRNWGVVYVANLVGAAGVAVLVFWSGQYRQGGGAIGERAVAIATAKASLDIAPAVVLGILANLLVCLAVWLSFSARSTTDRILAVVFPITAFVACGFEHSIANMYFLPLGLLVRDHVTDATGSLTWGDAIVNNLLPVTLGNMIGGGVLVGLTYWFVYLRGATTAD
jgi:formate/nitrite transporter